MIAVRTKRLVAFRETPISKLPVKISPSPQTLSAIRGSFYIAVVLDVVQLKKHDMLLFPTAKTGQPPIAVVGQNLNANA